MEFMASPDDSGIGISTMFSLRFSLPFGVSISTDSFFLVSDARNNSVPSPCPGSGIRNALIPSFCSVPCPRKPPPFPCVDSAMRNAFATSSTLRSAVRNALTSSFSPVSGAWKTDSPAFNSAARNALTALCFCIGSFDAYIFSSDSF